MARRTKVLKVASVGLLIFGIGIVLILCTLPVFTHTRQDLVQIPRSEAVIDSAFNIHQLERKTVQFQISIGQSLNIYVAANGNTSFSIANFTTPDGAIQLEPPDIVYFSQNDTATVNMTWSPQSRVPDPGKYYLVFLAPNAPSDSPVRVYANATKTWTDIQLKEIVAEDRIPLLDQRFADIGDAMVIFGVITLCVTFLHSRRRTQKRGR